MESTTALHPTLTRQDVPTPPQASSAWIAPSGDFYYVRNAGHIYSANLILGNDDDWASGDDTLQARGWMQVSGPDVYISRRATSAQLDTLWDMIDAYEAVGTYDARQYREALINEWRDIADGVQ